MSDYARLIQSEKFYKEKIRQLTEENANLKKRLVDMSYLVEPLILHDYMEENPSREIIDGELVED